MIEALLREAVIHARGHGRGKIHDDELRSEAGYAVARGLVEFDVGKGCTLLTYIKRLVRWAVLSLIRGASRYENRGPGFWDALQARGNCHSSVSEWNEAERLALNGATIAQVQRATGLSKRRADRFIKEVCRNARPQS